MSFFLVVPGLLWCLACLVVAVRLGFLHANGLLLLGSNAEYNSFALNIVNALLAGSLVFACGLTSFRAVRRPRLYLPSIVMLYLCCGIQVMMLVLNSTRGTFASLLFLFATVLFAHYLRSKADGSDSAAADPAAAVGPAVCPAADPAVEAGPAAETAAADGLAAAAGPVPEAAPSGSRRPADQPVGTRVGRGGRKRRAAAPLALRVLASLGLVVLSGVAFCLLHVTGHYFTGRYLVTQPVSELEAVEAGEDGALHVVSSYCSEAQDSSQSAPVMEIVWRDDWFDRPSTVYNHELATAAIELSMVANSEGHYYIAHETNAFFENCLTQLGFTDIDTSSYYLSSENLDEIGRIFRGETDVVAFGLGRKELSAAGASDGDAPAADDARTLVVCAIRGTWGSEWLSNFRINEAAGSADTAGFSDAADYVLEAIKEYTADLDPERTVVLVVGHSRGGAVSNIVGARLDELAGTPDEVAPRDSVFVYGFAVSGTTLSSDAGDGLYGNIFSIQVTGDLIPEVPLRSWGFTRYGVEMRFPGEGSQGYGELIARVQEHAEHNIGQKLSIDFYMADDLRELLDAVAARYSSASEVATLSGGVGIADLAVRYGVGEIIKYHFPDYYLALMESTEADDLILVSGPSDGPTGGTVGGTAPDSTAEGR